MGKSDIFGIYHPDYSITKCKRCGKKRVKESIKDVVCYCREGGQ